MFRRRRRRSDDPVDGVDAAALGPRWAPAVSEALVSRSRIVELIERSPDGPVRQRLDEMRAKVDAGVLAIWHTAQRADQLTLTIGGLDVGRITAEHKQAKRELAQAEQTGRVPPDLPERAEALGARHASAQRLMNALDDAEQRLTLLDARLDAAVVRVAEIALRADAGAEAAALDSELAQLVDELAALRSGLDAVG